MGDLGAFRGARRALRRNPIPRWQMGEASAALGEGGYGKVFPVSDDVVVKVVAINGDYTEDDMRAADITENPFREVAIYQRSNRLVAKAKTDHVAMLLAARRVGCSLRLYLERFDSNMYDWLRSGKSTDGALRSVVMQALHGYYVMERELGFFQSDFTESNVLVKEADVPRTWNWKVDGARYSAQSLGVFACLSDFGACDIDALPPLALSARAARREPHQRAMQPARFLDGVLTLALRSGVRGAFTDTLERVLCDRVLYERQEARQGSSELEIKAVEGRRVMPSGRSAGSGAVPVVPFRAVMDISQDIPYALATQEPELPCYTARELSFSESVSTIWCHFRRNDK
jgi:hypothetical protein